MLMFQNGLLVTFIPEILMVLAYLVCLFTPGFNSHNSNTEQAQIVAQVSTYVPQQITVYTVSTADFQIGAEIITDTKQSLPPVVGKDTHLSYESSFSTSDGLSYVDFSRPPPSLVS